MSNNTISAVIVAHNEEKMLENCLKSLDFVDEIIVVLDKCSDNSKEIAVNFGAKIIEGSWNIEGERRNIALKNATKEWILEIDADERISKKLAKEIKEAVNINENCGFNIPIANYIGSRYVKYGWLRTLCVEKRQSLTYRGLKKYDEDKEVHPTFNQNFHIKNLKNPIKHLVDENIADLIARFNRYTSWKSNDMIRKNKIKSGFFNLLIGAKIRFYKSYIIKKGYKEGYLGVLIAILSAIYPLTSYLKAKEKLDENS